jgi:uncharacterized protein YqeY
MSELRKQINDTVKEAMRARDKARLGVLRMVQAALKQIEVDERIELNDERILAELARLVKQRNESARQYDEAGRPELAEQERQEITVIQAFLPEQLDATAIEKIVDEAINAIGATGMADMGKLMGQLKPKLQGRADMATVSKLVRSRLAG